MWLFPLEANGEKCCTLTYGVNQRRNRIAVLFCFRVRPWPCAATWPFQWWGHRISQWSPMDDPVFLWWDNSVKKRQTPSQPNKRTTTTHFLTLTLYSFADFFFLTAFPWDLTIGISLSCPSFYLAVSHSLFLFSVLIVIWTLFAFLWCFFSQTSHQLSQRFACKKIPLALFVYWHFKK